MKKIIYWFRNDLRLHDQPVLKKLEQKKNVLLLPIFCFDERWFVKHKLGFPKTGSIRTKFLIESVNTLKTNLQNVGSDLLITSGKTEEKICEIAHKFNADEIYTEKEDTSEEFFIEEQLTKRLNIPVYFHESKTLLRTDQLPFSLFNLPDIFTYFRKKVEPLLDQVKSLETPEILPAFPDEFRNSQTVSLKDLNLDEPTFDERAAVKFLGGENEGLKQYSKFILGKIKEHNSKVTVDFRDPKITIEHVMPQKLDDSWIVELGEHFEEIHKNYLHNIGNLILTEFNSEIGNKSFEEKKRKLNTSSLNYRLDVINRNVWNEQSIKEHQTNMINWFLETFPLPYQYKNKANWNTQTIESTLFSPLDTDAGDIAEGNRPIELHIFDDIIRVNSWQDVFIKFLKYLKEKHESDFEYILDNQHEMFRRDEETIIKWSSLKEMIDGNINLTSRYKTFDGKTWYQVKELNGDTLFIHTNISASTCMSRVASVMQKLFLPDNSIQIKLR